MTRRTVLLNPGPVNISERVRRALHQEDMNMGDVTLDEYREFLRALAAVLAAAR
ncbi:MAG: hypothetical protein ACREMB_16170 [Candidatus Rokuibacteriota bacterium]